MKIFLYLIISIFIINYSCVNTKAIVGEVDDVDSKAEEIVVFASTPVNEIKITTQVETGLTKSLVEMEAVGILSTTVASLLTSTLATTTTIQPLISQSVEYVLTTSFNEITNISSLNHADLNENQIGRITTTNETQNVRNETLPVLNTQPINHEKNFINISIDSSNKIKFEIKNFTTIDSNATESKSYALRIHLQGYKWNDKYSDVNSSESINFLQEEIIPLLIENLNLSSDELHGVRLMKLFKGSVQSEVILETKNSLNETGDFNSDNHLIGNNTHKAIASKLVDSYNEFELKIIRGFDVNNKSAFIEMMHLVKFALLKHDSNIKDLNVTIVKTRLHDIDQVPSIVLTFQVFSEPIISRFDFYKAIEQLSIKEIDLKYSHKEILKLSIFLIELDYEEDDSKIDSANSFMFSYQTAWLISLIAISATLFVFFLTCIIAICYTRKPYKKSNKVYDMDNQIHNFYSNTNKKSNFNNNSEKLTRNLVPQIPSIQPATKTTQLRDDIHMHY